MRALAQPRVDYSRRNLAYSSPESARQGMGRRLYIRRRFLPQELNPRHGLVPRNIGASSLSGRSAMPGPPRADVTPRSTVRKAPSDFAEKFAGGWPRDPQPPARRVSAPHSPAAPRKKVAANGVNFALGNRRATHSNDCALPGIVSPRLDRRP